MDGTERSRSSSASCPFQSARPCRNCLMPHDPHFSSRDSRDAPEWSESGALGPAYGDRPTRSALFWQRQRRRIRLWSSGFIFLALLGAGSWGVSTMLSDEEKAGLRDKLSALDPLAIKHIVIYGRELTEESDVLDMLDTRVGNGLFGFSVEKARRRIDTLPFIAHSTVERRLPDTIVVTLVERVPIAIWQNGGRFELINKDGEQVSQGNVDPTDAHVFRKLPLVVGRGANTQAASVIEALNRYPDLRTRTLALVRIGERRWNLALDNGMQILLPEGQEDAAFHRLTEYQDHYQLLDRPLAAIDMRLPDRMVIRLRHPGEVPPVLQVLKPASLSTPLPPSEASTGKPVLSAKPLLPPVAKPEPTDSRETRAERKSPHLSAHHSPALNAQSQTTAALNAASLKAASSGAGRNMDNTADLPSHHAPLHLHRHDSPREGGSANTHLPQGDSGLHDDSRPVSKAHAHAAAYREHSDRFAAREKPSPESGSAHSSGTSTSLLPSAPKEVPARRVPSRSSASRSHDTTPLPPPQPY
ncbi:FtsQ-type POTRA domain-containing protein [Oecophyllibacter saccharovorans]|nr:FtsQ-type POTRA domain-containing protein [Oecophyllibacter saccharovorans]